MTFEEVLKWAPDNADVFEELKKSIKKGTVIPFIGAGMSSPVFPLWGEVLERLTGKLSSEDKRNEINSILNDPAETDAYTKAADRLIELRSETNVCRDMLKIFNEDLIDDGKLRGMAVCLLPFLFHDRPAVTTNYDRVLEHVYRMRGIAFDGVFCPDSDLAAMTAQQDLHCLFKIHGDIGKEVLDRRKLILSGKSYESVYKPGSELVSTLQSFYKGKMMLFLGSSLRYDRTFEVLKQVTGTGILSHYAILPSSREKVDDNSAFFGGRGIRAIFYDEDHHESVRIILEELLRETRPDKYREYKEYTADLLPDEGSKNPFVYDARVIGFYGREEELQVLSDFTKARGSFSWLAITGEGGSGKTRLVYEFTNSMRLKGWNIIKVGRDDLQNPTELNKRVTEGGKNIVWADYGQSFAKELGRWMTNLASPPFSSTNRIIVIEREQSEIDSSLLSMLSEEDYNGRLKDALWGGRFLKLKALGVQGIADIMRSYCAYRKKSIDGNSISALLQVLENVDPGLMRPLYALFITDAYCAGEDPRHWDRTRVLDWMVEREEKLRAAHLRRCTGQGSRNQTEAFDAVCFIATINGDIGIEEIKAEYKDCWEKYEKAFMHTITGNDLEACIEGSGLSENGTVKAVRPDLLGEYYVLKKFKVYKNLFHYNGWTDNIDILSFLFRLTYDYRDQKGMISAVGRMLSDSVPKNERVVLWYAGLIMNITAFADAEDDCKMLAEILGKLYSMYGWTAPEYAKGLVNLSAKQDPEEAGKSVARIGELSAGHEGNEEIVLRYAEGLVNLSTKQGTEEAGKSIARIGELNAGHEGNEEIALAYAKGLVNLSGKQGLEEARESVARIGELSAKHEGNEEIALAYANGLFNLNFDQSLEEALESVARIGELRSKHEGNEEIALTYARGLLNLSVRQGPEEARKSIARLGELSAGHEGNEEIALEYANGLVNLSSKQGIEEAGKSIARLGELSARHEGNEEFALAYAKGLFNLSAKQGPEEAGESVARISRLSAKHEENEGIALALVRGLFTLSADQSLEEERESITRIGELSKKYKRNEEIALVYAKGLVNLSADQDPKGAGESIDRLDKLSAEHEGNEEIALEYAKGLVNLSGMQDLGEAGESVDRLDKLSAEHEGNDEIALEYAKGLYNLIIDQDPEEAWESVTRIVELCAKHERIKRLLQIC